jgi:hypothetical protein
MFSRSAIRSQLQVKWPDLMVLAALILPGLFMTDLVRTYVVDTPFYDDFTFIEDWVRLKKGELHLGDLFTAHMEHRVILPRFMALGLHIVFGRDLRWQNITTLLLVWGSAGLLVRIFLRSAGVTLRQAAFPLLLFSMLIFCAIQWQGLLWPICFEIYIPLFTLALSIYLWQAMRNPAAALILAALSAVAGTTSFASGALTWVLMLPLFWVSRDDLDKRQRIRFVGAWLIMAAITLGLYTMNFKNAVPAQFAYGQGSEVTLHSDVDYFIHNLDKAATFLPAVLGGHLSRGLNLHNLYTAQQVGAVSLAALGLFGVLAWIYRKEHRLLQDALPWFAIGGYSVGTAFMITVGRLWRSRSGSLAVDGRYASHAIPLSIALVALAFLFGRRFKDQRPWLAPLGWVAGGALFMLVSTQWIYGSRMMEIWQQARLQGKALLHFTKVFPNKDFLGQVSGEAKYGADLILEMERLKLLSEPLAESLDLPQRHLAESKADLRPRLGQFRLLQRLRDGTMIADGFAELPDRRPADLILFTWSPSPGVDRIFGLTTLDRMPRYFAECSYKDYEFCSVTTFGPADTSQWQPKISLATVPPEGATITAWAVDIQRRRVLRIDDARALPSARLPRGIYPNSEPPKK